VILGDADDQAELMLFQPVRAPESGVGVTEARYGTLSSGEGSGYDAPVGLLDAGGGRGLLMFASSLCMCPFAFCAVSGFPLAS